MGIMDLLALYIIINLGVLIIQIRSDLDDGEILLVSSLCTLKESINKKGVKAWHILACIILVIFMLPSFIIYNVCKFIIITFLKSIIYILNINIIKLKNVKQDKNEVKEDIK